MVDASGDVKMVDLYPDARRDEFVVDDYHGTKIPDPYRWMEELNSKETLSFASLQNQLCMSYLSNCPNRDEMERRSRELHIYEQDMCPSPEGDRYLFRINSGSYKDILFYSFESFESGMRLVIDPSELSNDNSVAITDESVSQDGKVFAYGLRKMGSDWMQVHFRNMDDGSDHPDVLINVKFSSLSWSADNKGIFYSGYLDITSDCLHIRRYGPDGSRHYGDGHLGPLNCCRAKKQSFFYHQLGTPQANDVLIVNFPEQSDTCRIEGEATECGRYLVVRLLSSVVNNFVYVGELPQEEDVLPEERMPLRQIVHGSEAEYEYVDNTGTVFLFHTNNDAPNSQIVSINLDDDEPEWRVFLPEHPSDVLEWAIPVMGDKLLVGYTAHVRSVIQLLSLMTGELLMVLPSRGATVTEVTGHKRHTECFYKISSYLIPSIIYRCSYTEGDQFSCQEYTKVKYPEIDLDKYECYQVHYASKDGTEIPLFMVHKKKLDMDGSHPCLMTGYGGFANCTMPEFNIFLLMFMEHFGGVVAVPNIRGGGEFGKKWHDAGRLQYKQNSFDDFHAAAEFLMKSGYTSRRLLTIKGASNGGLLVAACANQRPDLYAAVIIQSGLLDMLRYPLFTVGKAWMTEYGDPSDPDAFATLIAYSPLHNCSLSSSMVPAILVVAGENDDRVVPLHSLKYIANLQHHHRQRQHHRQCGGPLLAKITANSGHSGDRSDCIDALCFLVKALGIEYK